MMYYVWAEPKDAMELSVKRLAACGIGAEDAAYENLLENCMEYFREALPVQSCEAVMAQEQGRCLGVGILFYYRSVPSAFNPKGKYAYIACMYVEPEYRGLGIGTELLQRLMDRSKGKGYDAVLLNSSEMGMSLYRKAGFVPVENGMIYSRN